MTRIGGDVIPYTRHHLSDAAIAAANRVMRNGDLAQGVNARALARMRVKQDPRAQYAVPCSSGTAALWLALRAIGVDQHTTVLVPDITFAATASAALLLGARVRLVDCDARTGMPTPTQWEWAAADAPSRDVVWLPVLLRGDRGDLREVIRCALFSGARVVVDAAHAHNYQLDDGVSAACYSYHATKVLGVGEGGCAVFARERYGIAAEIYANVGRDRHGLVAAPSHNLRMPEVTAALALQAHAEEPRRMQRLEEIARYYHDRIHAKHAPRMPEHGSGMHLFTIAPRDRAALRSRLRERGIGTQVHYAALHTWPAFRHLGTQALAGAEEYARETLSIPFFASMTDEQVRRVAEELKA